MRRLLVIAVVVGLIPLVSATVEADTRRTNDPDDARGPLDIAWIEHAHRATATGGQRLVHTVRLYERWPVQDLRDRGFINLFFDLKGNRGGRDERAVYVSYENGKLRAYLYNFAADPPRFLRRLPLTRPDGRTIRVVLRKNDLRRRSFDHYRWSTTSFVEEGHRSCGRPGGCDDAAPEGGYLRHDL